MPVKRAAFKAHRQNQKTRLRNAKVKLSLKKFAVQLRKALTAQQADQAKKIAADYSRALDKAAQNGVLHRNTAARLKSRISAQLKRSR